jgi:1,4-dihydroxy-2-naphthoate octaprenyltransferase
MKKSKAILLLLRLPFLTVTIGGVLVGTAYAVWSTGRPLNVFHFILTLLGACFLHIACNVANDYFDFKSGTDAANKDALVPFSGGSRMVLDGFVKPGEALAVSIVFAVLGGLCGLYLNFVTPGNVILIIGIVAVIFVYGYNGFPLRLVNKGLGEIAIFLSWGPLMVFGAYYVQSQTLNYFWPLILSITSGFLTTLVLLINEFADKEADARSGRKTWVILFGFNTSLVLYLFLALACYLVVAAGIIFASWPLWTLLVLLTLPLPFVAYRLGRRNLGNWPDFLPAVKNTILLNFVFCILLSIAFFI